MTTIAQVIANKVLNSETRYIKDIGVLAVPKVDIQDLCEASSIGTITYNGNISYRFSDDSRIVVYGNTLWDIVIKDCTCGFCGESFDLYCSVCSTCYIEFPRLPWEENRKEKTCKTCLGENNG